MRLLPSVKDIGASLAQVLRRFFPVVIAALGATACAMTMLEYSDSSPALTKALMACVLGVPWFFALSLIRERELPDWRGMALVILGLILIVLYDFGLQTVPSSFPFRHVERFFLLLAGAHCLAAIAPFLGRREPAAFWQFNKALFLRFLLGALYAAVLYVGLSLALLSMDKLLGLKFKGEIYGHLWMLITGVFHPLFFLAGVPGNFETLESEPSYPVGLRRFVQFVLVPLVVVYLAILYLYATKILFAWHLPNGWVALPVLILAVVGILAALLLQPIRTRAEFRWTDLFILWFYRLLLPLTVLLMLSIGRRIHDYGVTEHRYFTAILALWLPVTCGLFAWRHSRSIKWIPASLGTLCLVTAFGPWSAFDVSYRSQHLRLISQLQQLGVLRDGRVIARPQTVNQPAYEELRSTLDYLLSHHDPATLDPLMTGFKEWKFYVSSAGDDSRGDRYSAYNKTGEFLLLAGLKSGSSSSYDVTFQLAPPGIVTSDAAAFITFHDYNAWTQEKAAIVPDGSVTIETTKDSSHLRLGSRGDHVDVDWLIFFEGKISLGGNPSQAIGAGEKTLGAADLTLRKNIGGRQVAFVVTRAFLFKDGSEKIVSVRNISFFTIVTPTK